MHDLPQDSWRIQRDLQDRLTTLIAGFGYRCLETPFLEPTELFLRKSGGELASRIYSFSDPGSNLVSLRPEFTSSIMRHYLEHSEETDLPTRWQYAGPVFRYEVSHPEASGQFTQIGAELVGASSILADAEVLGMAAQVLESLGVSGWRLDLADLDVLTSVLDAVGVSERAKSFIIGSVPRLRDGGKAIPQMMEEARHLHVTGQNTQDDYLAQAVEGLDDDRARVVLRGLLQWSVADQLGQRNPEDVVERLLRKLRGSDKEDSLQRGLELAASLAAVNKEPKSALNAVYDVVRTAGADETAFQRLSQLLDLISTGTELAEHLNLDFGLVRGLAYYNGIVFEVKHPSWSGSLGGGGRYDGLAMALGSSETVPALGFAYNMEALLAVAVGEEEGGRASLGRSEVLVISSCARAYRGALEAAKELRQEGITTELEVESLDLESALATAKKKGIGRIVMIDEDGQRINHEVG